MLPGHNKGAGDKNRQVKEPQKSREVHSPRSTRQTSVSHLRRATFGDAPRSQINHKAKGPRAQEDQDNDHRGCYKEYRRLRKTRGSVRLANASCMRVVQGPYTVMDLYILNSYVRVSWIAPIIGTARIIYYSISRQESHDDLD